MEEVAKALARVAASLPGGGEQRVGQREMAEAVARAISERRHLVVQAGTGTGKSLAYLIPALLSGRPVVVSTATKALQDQLAGNDLPRLAAALGVPFDWAVLKGRSNYVCRQRAREVLGADDQLELGDAEGASTSRLFEEVKHIVDWSQTTGCSGDRADLDLEPSPRAWAAVSVSAMECPGAAKCPSGGECFAERARDLAAEADVIVVNTHLYGAHLASGGNVLPDHDVVVFDEAHALEDVASSSLGVEIGPGRFAALARHAKALVHDDPAVVEALGTAGDLVASALSRFEGQRLPPGLGEVAPTVALAEERVRAATAAMRKSTTDEARKDRALQAAGHLVGDLAFVREADASNVVWVERGPGGTPLLKMAPVDVGPQLRDRLWADVTAVLTSATIPPLLAGRLGMEAGSWDDLDVGSPFAYDTQALLYCAAHLPDPRAPAFADAFLDELEALLIAAGGRTLALFTSWRAMQDAAKAMADRVPFRIFTQSDLPKPALIKAFTEEPASCLFATMGFWQGVDVPGTSLSQVIIDRIPFPRPDEPLLSARREKAGAAAFRTIDLPRAATMLAQGSGRLIRSANDRGVVAVLDPRLASAGYRWDLVRALPPMRRTKVRAEVEAFLAPLRDQAV